MIDTVTKHPDSDEELDDNVNFKAIEYNQCLIEGIDSFERRDFAKALDRYSSALQFVNDEDIERRSLLNSNIALIHFYNHDYKKALAQLESTLHEFKTYKDLHSNLTDYQQAIFIKLLGNICALNLFLNKCEDSRDCANEIIRTIDFAKQEKKRLLYEGLCYTFFRFKNFEMLKDGYFQNLETKYNGETLGCLYLILGLNRQLLNDNQLALIYYRKAFDVWKGLGDQLFLLLTCRHITTLANELGIAPEYSEYFNVMKTLMSREEMKNISLDLLFKDFERRLAFAKEITGMIKSQEDKLKAFSPRESLRKDKVDEVNEKGVPFWKQALTFKLTHAIRSLDSLKNDIKTKPGEKKSLDAATIQIRKTLAMLQTETNPLVMEQLKNMKYTREAIDTVKANLNSLRKIFLKPSKEGFRRLVMNKDYRDKERAREEWKRDPRSIYAKADKTVRNGERLTKLNFGNGSKSIRFFMVSDNGDLRWANSEKDINNRKAYKSCSLSEIRGVCYGKVSNNMIKNGKNLDDWLCVSIITLNRSIDLYLTPDQLNLWYIGLSQAVKIENPEATILSVGRFLWRKLSLMGMSIIAESMGLKKKGKGARAFRSFVEALVELQRNPPTN